MVDVTVPQVGESVSEVQIGRWLIQEGEWIASGQDLVELETEKASVQIIAPASGYLRGVRKKAEEFATVGEVIGEIEPAEAPAAQGSAPSKPAETKPAAATPAPAAPSVTAPAVASGSESARVMPAASRMLQENNLQAKDVAAIGPGGRLLKEDVQAHLQKSPSAATTSVSAPAASRPSKPAESSLVAASTDGRTEEVKPLSMIRRTIAARLVEAQQNAALLTTFNEVDMQPVMQLRKKYQDLFVERHGVKLGFMSFYAKAAVEALRRFPAVNAEIRGNSIVYRHYCDIGIAIGGGKGLVVPILRNVERMSFSDVERAIADFAKKAGENRLTPEDLEGGTFTISNGGIYGSLLSTPIVNPPQSGILGLHSIQDRPVARDGQVVIRPMMYLALTYDHRIVDGREAVSFLRTIKDVIEDPSRLFLEL
jgi:2-oxoglutarate dehydrogenase E2 component (dihydrolipoamide succinyltransferase)